jgi:hypothetical protein
MHVGPMDPASGQGVTEACRFPYPSNLSDEPLANFTRGKAIDFDAHSSRNIPVTLLNLAVVKINHSIQEHGVALAVRQIQQAAEAMSHCVYRAQACDLHGLRVLSLHPDF